jgi:hypothetical protein
MDFSKEVERLRKGIQDYLDGNYVSPRSFRSQGAQTKCPHGMYYWDTCENCIDEHFLKVLRGEGEDH